MFCAGCGSEIQSALNYCSRCGRRVADDREALANATSNPLLIAGGTAGIGMFAFVILMRILVRDGVTGSDLVGITAFYFAALFGICTLILRYGRIFRDDTKSQTINGSRSDERAYLPPVITAQLPESMTAPASVTDHTTRTLDKVVVERD